MKISKVILSMFLLSVLIISCNDDDDDVMEPKGDYENGLLISGQGSTTISGSVSFVSNDFVTVEHQIYSQVNSNNVLGEYLQSIAFDTENAYICVDNQNSITIVDRYTFVENNVITDGLKAPRYMVVENGKGYVTNWGTSTWGNIVDDAFVAIVNLTTQVVEKTIAVGVGPERIVENNGKLYVSHKGGLGVNNVISVIDIDTEEIEEIIVKDLPDELFFDNQNNLVVLCEGKAAWTGDETVASIIKINTSSNTISSTLDFSQGVHPSLLEQDGSNLYYNVNSEIYKLENSSTSLPNTSFMDTGAIIFNGMAINDGSLFVTHAESYGAQSILDVYDLVTKTKINTTTVPPAASNIYFN